jgi:hypothetical protein
MTTAEVIASLPWAELGAKKVRVGWTTERLDSRIALVTIADLATREERDVIVKQHREGTDAVRSAGTRARYEYDTLLALRAAMANERGTSVPRPLLVNEPLGAIVIDRAVGRALDERIRDGKRSRAGARDLVPLVRRAGTWLRLMQQQTRTSDDARPLIRNVVARALTDLDAISASDWLIRRRRKRIAETLQSLEQRVTSAVTGHHGDYWPGNIFMDDARVEVIDFEGYRLGLPIEDAAYFLVQLDLLFPRYRRRLPPLREAFLDGYFAGAARDEDALRLFTLTKTLYVLGRPPGAAHALPIRVWLRHMQRRIVLDGTTA